jgi:plastocyanin
MRSLMMSTLVAAIGATSLVPALAQAASETVTISNYTFGPAKLVIHAGDKVTWINHDSMPHTASALDGQSFDSGALDPGASWSFVFSKVGDFKYRCAIHPDMRGEIVVE